MSSDDQKPIEIDGLAVVFFNLADGLPQFREHGVSQARGITKALRHLTFDHAAFCMIERGHDFLVSIDIFDDASGVLVHFDVVGLHDALHDSFAPSPGAFDDDAITLARDRVGGENATPAQRA